MEAFFLRINYSLIIYLDESGDLGWKFDAPYRRGGSSRYLTISSLCVPSTKEHIPKRVIRSLYNEYKWSTDTEIKWARMKCEQRKRFAEVAHKMCLKHSDISLRVIVVNKQNVMEHIKDDGNKLYNYMIKLMLLDFMAEFEAVNFIPDPRSIKVQSGNSLHDYLQTELWFTKNTSTKLITNSYDSKSSQGLQFSDMLAGLVQSHHEDNNTDAFQLLNQKILLKRLFF